MSVCIPNPQDTYQLLLPQGIQNVNIVLGIACILGQFFISSCFLYIPVLREHPNSLLFWNCMSDLCFHTYLICYTWIFPQTKKVSSDTCMPTGLCMVGCFLYVFLYCCSLGWNFVIGIDLVIMLKKPFSKRSTFKVLYHVAIWTGSFVMAILAVTVDRKGIRFVPEKNTCFIADESHLLRMTITLPLFLCTVINIPVLFYIVKTLRRGLTSKSSQANRVQIVARFTLYTLATTVLWSLPLVGQLIPIFLPETKYKMYYVQRTKFNIARSVFENGQSIVDILVYGTHPAILAFLFKCIKYRGDKRKILGDVVEDVKDLELTSHKTETVDQNGLSTYSPPTLQKAFTPGSGIDITLRRDVIMGLMYCMNYILRPDSDLWPSGEADLFENAHYARLDKLLIQKPTDPSRTYSKMITADHPIKYYVYAPEVFKRLRETFCGGEEIFLDSFPYPLPENAFADQFSEGKSGSFFSKTIDEKYIIKSVSKSEAKVLIKILSNYYEYMTENVESFVARIYGLYSIKLYQGFKMTFLVMSNIFPPKRQVPIHSRFDVKGSWVNRSNAAYLASQQQWEQFLQEKQRIQSMAKNNVDDSELGENEATPNSPTSPNQSNNFSSTILGPEEDAPIESELGLDMDIKDPLDIGEENAEFVKNQLKKDSNFLAQCSIMDYSLLIGIHKNNKRQLVPTESGRQMVSGCLGFWSSSGHELYFVGIIDILQVFNVSKKAEKLWKHVVMRKDRHGISSQPPGFYSIRFQERICTIFF